MAKTDLTSVWFTSVWLTPPSPSNEFLEIIIALNIVLQTLHTIYREVRHVCFQFCLDDIIRIRDGRICQIVQGILQILCYIRFTMIFCITFFSATHFILSSILVQRWILENPLGILRATWYTNCRTDLFRRHYFK